MLSDRLHRTTNRRAYQRSIDDAHRIVQEALKRFGEPAAVGVSGGKDSVAMCHVVAQHCRPLVIWNDSGLELPESEGIVSELAALLGLEVCVAKGVDALELELGETQTSAARTDELCIIAPVREAIATRGVRVEFVGLRAAESRRRKMVLAMHGPIYDSQRFGCGIAWPMRRWSTADIFAYIDEHSLPLHPAYTRTEWADRDSIRVSWAWDSTRERVGDLEYVRRYYPALYQRIRSHGGH